ncbi:hypothetical protein [Actinomadura sp. GTD37]
MEEVADMVAGQFQPPVTLPRGLMRSAFVIVHWIQVAGCGMKVLVEQKAL